MDDKDNKSNNDSQSLIKLIKNTGYEQFYELGSKEQIICQQPVIVGTVSSDGGKATIAFPSDPTYFTTLQFVNCTGTKLTTGDKVYLQHKFDNPSQGWLVSNQNNYKIGSVTPYSGVTVSPAQIRQLGGTVYIVAHINIAARVSASPFSINLFTLSGVSLPSTSVDFPISILNTVSCAYGTLTTSGNVQVYGYQGANTTWSDAYINFSYFV